MPIIRPLPERVANSIRASCIVSRLERAVEECVSNSIDARSSSITVYITEDGAQIVDDGEGITGSDFKLLGHWHCTSKEFGRVGKETLGFRGTALAAISTVAALEITSKHRTGFETLSKVLEGGKTLKHGLASLQQRRQGTTVCIKGFQARAHSPCDVQDRTRHKVFLLGFVHPNVGFQVTDGNTGHLLLNMPKGRTEASMLPAVFGDQPCLSAHHSIFKQLALRLLISSPDCVQATRHSQLVYVNRRVVACPQIVTLISSLHQAAQDTVNTHHQSGPPAFICMIQCDDHLYTLSHDVDSTAVEFLDWAPLMDAVQTAMLQAFSLADLHDTSAHAAGELQHLADRQGSQDAPRTQNRSCPLPAKLWHPASLNSHPSLKDVGPSTAGKDQAAPRTSLQQQLPPSSLQASNIPGSRSSVTRENSHPRSAPAAPGGKRRANYSKLSHKEEAKADGVRRKPLSLLPGKPAAHDSGIRKFRGTSMKGYSSGSQALPVGRSDSLLGVNSRRFKQRADQQQADGDRKHVRLIDGHSLTPLDALFDTWANPCTSSEADVLDIKRLAKGYMAQVVPESLTKRHLDAARVLQQVDCKFIVVVCEDMIAVMDQHAADERVLLEQLLAKVAEPGHSQIIASQALDAPVTWLCPSSNNHILRKHQAEIEAWGWRYILDKANAVMTNVPCVLGRVLTVADLKAYTGVLEDARGAAKVPQGIMRVLASKACRSAVMFGDRLSADDAKHLVAGLQRTSLWSICAHGRPTIAPLAHLPTLHQCVKLRVPGPSKGAGRMPLALLKEKLLRCIGTAGTAAG